MFHSFGRESRDYRIVGGKDTGTTGGDFLIKCGYKTGDVIPNRFYRAVFSTLSPDECFRRMNSSRILAVNDEQSRPAEPVMGIPLEYLSFAIVNNHTPKKVK